MRFERLFFSFGSLSAAVSVAAGAYGAHAEGSALNATEAEWITKAARYQMYHGLALLAVAIVMKQWPTRGKLLTITGLLFVVGICCFSGSLYLMAFTPVDAGLVTPLGGVTMIIGWCILAFVPWTKDLPDKSSDHS
jgi:uncharacterized membrane protein YgdD (TMEM256/DUF423 family)